MVNSDAINKAIDIESERYSTTIQDKFLASSLNRVVAVKIFHLVGEDTASKTEVRSRISSIEVPAQIYLLIGLHSHNKQYG
jgi:hypothetical protein